jgi:hypothetical protein
VVLEKVSWKQWVTFIQAKTQSRVSVEVEVEARHGGGSDGEKNSKRCHAMGGVSRHIYNYVLVLLL